MQGEASAAARATQEVAAGERVDVADRLRRVGVGVRGALRGNRIDVLDRVMSDFEWLLAPRE